jgi:CRISPR-associated protein Csx17
MIQHEMLLGGCRSDVLASYLKALGILRVVAEQVPGSEALGSWDRAGGFCLRSTLDQEALVAFFLESYAPTPIVTPWNGGGGFFPKDNQTGISALEQSTAPRFAAYRETIEACRAQLAHLKIKEKPDEEQKRRLLPALRRWLPDAAVRWLDATCVFSEDPRYPALLGTGGNDGRLDFANNFMQRLAEVLLQPPAKTGRSRRAAAEGDRPLPAQRLRAALFGDNRTPGLLQNLAIGQFSPAAAGGINMSSDIEGESRVNPWDYILMLEGAILFAGAAVRRLEVAVPGSAAFPFQVRASAVGYGSAADKDEDRQLTRGEIWLPLWSAPTPLAEIVRLFSEGRIDVGRRRASTGLDAARALVNMGVDRGIDRFERISFLRRNGLSYLATSLGSLAVRRGPLPGIDLLDELDALMYGAQGADRPEVARALRRLQEAVFQFCRAGGTAGAAPRVPLADVLAAAGLLERSIARAVKLHGLRPCRPLSPGWYAAGDDGSPEFALAAAVASWGIRSAWEPVDPQDLRRFTERRLLWVEGDVLGSILAVARRRLLDQGAAGLLGASPMTTEHLWLLLSERPERALDLPRLEALIFGLSLLERLPLPRPPLEAHHPLSPVFCVLRALTSPRYLARREDDDKHPAPRLILQALAQLQAGDAAGALDLAVRGLRGRRVRLKLDAPEEQLRGALPRGDADLRPLAVALLLPLAPGLERRLIERVILPPENETMTSPDDPMETPHA